ncbi:uncharacterized protein LOC115274591 [Suricata suricatta]|uniref:uncharacterized protein LOC115274591 n=1 Tax=Suricata suricatta TaxID=37032 RepID=UPI001155C3FC|nr:uncharacterized protein LOC115274591 [Suricata suricatta]
MGPHQCHDENRGKLSRCVRDAHGLSRLTRVVLTAQELGHGDTCHQALLPEKKQLQDPGSPPSLDIGRAEGGAASPAWEKRLYTVTSLPSQAPTAAVCPPEKCRWPQRPGPAPAALGGPSGHHTHGGQMGKLRHGEAQGTARAQQEGNDVAFVQEGGCAGSEEALGFLGACGKEGERPSVSLQKQHRLSGRCGRGLHVQLKRQGERKAYDSCALSRRKINHSGLFPPRLLPAIFRRNPCFSAWALPAVGHPGSKHAHTAATFHGPQDPSYHPICSLCPETLPTHVIQQTSTHTSKPCPDVGALRL